MTRTMILVAIVVAVVLVLSATAALAGSADVFLRNGTTVGGKSLPAGQYTIRWSGAGDSLSVKVTGGGRELAKVPAALETRAEASANDGVLYEKSGENAWKIKEVRFAGKKEVLTLKD